jgi:hypothetical protein
MNSDSSGEFVGVVAILVIFGMPIAYLIANRFYSHQERMAMIQRGLTPPPDSSKWSKRAAAGGWYGQSMQPQAYDPFAYEEWRANRSLRKGITLAMLGFALLVGLSISLGPTGPWLLGGLIPLFVGIAQIIIAVLSGARFGAFGMMPPTQGSGHEQQFGQAQYQQPPPPFAGTTRDVSAGPFGWRPGPTTELEKPPSPPDTRQ